MFVFLLFFCKAKYIFIFIAKHPPIHTHYNNTFAKHDKSVTKNLATILSAKQKNSKLLVGVKLVISLYRENKSKIRKKQ